MFAMWGSTEWRTSNQRPTTRWHVYVGTGECPTWAQFWSGCPAAGRASEGLVGSGSSPARCLCGIWWHSTACAVEPGHTSHTRLPHWHYLPQLPRGHRGCGEGDVGKLRGEMQRRVMEERMKSDTNTGKWKAALGKRLLKWGMEKWCPTRYSFVDTL